MKIKKAVIGRLCTLVSRVGEDVFNSQESHDCFCHDYDDDTAFVVSDKILEFIEGAVNKAIKEKVVE